ncbi:hypothetical protein COU56_01925 [Candidatus Pacearchaeota archaeon CG10_big_fil_rev_8_21_14_0_10_31_9]|nr:MAG: hypothetical protein COU56_01925 [Candidatus Pacearchaeota archaeon CG10_big_fil_rev_8_21_14_0_10_31_9]
MRIIFLKKIRQSQEMKNLAVILIFGILINLNFVFAQNFGGSGTMGQSFSSYGSASFTNVQYFSPGYFPGASSGLGAYSGVSIEEFNEVCRNRQDFVIQIAPGSCTPSVVRSDLLAEQNVPVFCQLTATQVNPLINTQNIRSIRLVSNGNVSQDIIGVSYYRPQREIFAKKDSNGFLSFSNIGYAIIILKRQPNENLQPDFIYGNLTAYLSYGTSGQLGAQLNEKLIPVLNDEDWNSYYQEYSFLDGRGFFRVEDLSGDRAKISVYRDANTKVDSFIIEKGQKSNERYLAGGYCNAGYNIEFLDSVQTQEKASILLDGDEYEVFEGGKFGDNCAVRKLYDTGFGTGKVDVKCLGTKDFSLEIKHKPVKLNFDSSDKNFEIGEKLYATENSSAYLGAINKKVSEGGKFFIVLVDAKEFTNSLKGNINKFSSEIALGTEENVAKEKYLKDNTIAVVYKGNKGNIGGKEVSFIDFTDIENVETQSAEFEKYFGASVDSYKNLEEQYGEYDYPEDTTLPDQAKYNKYGEVAVSRATDLAKTRGEVGTEMEFAKIGEDNYGLLLSDKLSSIEFFNYQDTSYEFEIDGITHRISLEKITSVDLDKIKVIISVNGDKKVLHRFGEYLIPPDGTKSITLKSFDDDSVSLEADCGSKTTETISLGKRAPVCSMDIYVKEIKTEKLAKFRITPVQRTSDGVANLSYGIGVEKRAFPLSPEKSLERINRLNESIEKWKNINENLGKLVKAGKAACFGTSAALQVKNLLSGMGGKAIAREVVMKNDGGWDSICQAEVAEGKYSSLDACFRSNADKIEEDVSSVTNIVKEQDAENKEIDNANKIEGSGMFSNGIDGDEAYTDYLSSIKSRYSSSDSIVKNEKGDKQINIGEVVSGLESGSASREDLREIDLHMRILKESDSDSLKAIAEKSLYDKLQPIQQESLDNKDKSSYVSNLEAKGVVNVGNVEVISSNKRSKIGEYNGEVTSEAIGSIVKGSNIKPIIFDGKKYLLKLDSVDDTKFTISRVDDVPQVFDENGNLIGDKEEAELVASYFTQFVKYNTDSYRNGYDSPLVRYYEHDPYKGMPAIVPFDTQNGWYAGTKQTLATFNNIASYDESGRISSFWLCNVGTNHREEFTTGFGDDICQQFNLNTGQPLDQFPGLNEEEAVKLVKNAIQSLEQASQQYSTGVRKVKILGKTYDVGTPAVSTPSAQCQDFMSPKDCQLMFNVCDPVICPSSRCNLGGKYQVDDVVQTGIVGSILMCLPNAKEGIVVPICLTGVNAGIENFVSILEASRDCLQESVDSGTYVGICDEITAVYKCEFFWNQVSPALNVMLPKLLERVSGQGVRGGGEYAGVSAAWQNMQNSIDYFKNQYSINALKAFRVRSTQEVGTPICKAFVSARFANKFSSLIEPDSPYQFSAWFDEILFTTATTPSLSQYKVFYHIYAGNDQGIYYSVYLKEPTGSSFIQSTGVVVVDTGFVGRGEYNSQAKDFTAPSGFKQLCVRINGEEKCGFKQVSTSFAVNYVRDKYVQDQLNQTNIKSERECISGSPGALALVNPNLESGVEDATLPQIYERGIVRVCSSGNPGSAVDPSRWVEVGYCDDKSISCWLDRESVDRAISSENIGVKNQTKADLNALADRIAERDKTGLLIEDSGGNIIFEDFEKEIDSLSSSSLSFSDAETNSKIILAKINEVEDKYQLLDKDYARLFFDRAWTYEMLARKSPYPEKEVPVSEPNETVDSGAGGSEGEETPTDHGTAGETGVLSSEVPAILQGIFIEASDATGTPASLIAAISYQECGDLWNDAKRDEPKIKSLIENNGIPRVGDLCNSNNGYNVFGPMQFQIGIDYLAENGFDNRIRTINPKGIALPREGTWEDYDDSAASLLKVSVDEISPLVIRHAVYAAAIKLNKDAGDPSVWTDEDIRNAAKGYFGACDDTQVIGGDEVVVHYCDDIISKYNKYKA